MEKKKPGLMVAIALGKKPHGDEGDDPEHEAEEEMDGDDDGDAYADAGSAIKDALKSGDDQAIADAVCRLIDLHTESKE